jgi:hypothetical protein
MNQYKLNLRDRQGKILSATVKAKSMEEASALIKKNGYEVVTDSNQEAKEANNFLPPINPTKEPTRSSRSVSPKKPTNRREKVKRSKRVNRGNRSALRLGNKNNYIIFGIVGVVAVIFLAFLLVKNKNHGALTPETGWYQYSADESKFNIFLPGSITFDKKIGEEQHFYYGDDKDRTFMVIFTKYSFLNGLTAYSEKTSNLVLNTLVNITKEHVKGSIKSKIETKINGFNAIDVVIQADDSTYGRMMNILTPNGSYSIGIACPKESALNDQKTNTFINSIKFY